MQFGTAVVRPIERRHERCVQAMSGATSYERRLCMEDDNACHVLPSALRIAVLSRCV